MRLKIPQAMAWKYQAKCSKTLAGDDILVWLHPTLPQPSKAQVAIDVAEYEAWEIIDEAERVQAELDLENELKAPAGNPMNVLKALRRLGKI